MKIMLNGEPFELQNSTSPAESADVTTVACLVAQRKLNPRQIAVEVNCQLIPRENYETSLLADGDSVEVVTLAGGG